jgi:hypothetical protein
MGRQTVLSYKSQAILSTIMAEVPKNNEQNFLQFQVQSGECMPTADLPANYNGTSHILSPK